MVVDGVILGVELRFQLIEVSISPISQQQFVKFQAFLQSDSLAWLGTYPRPASVLEDERVRRSNVARCRCIVSLCC